MRTPSKTFIVLIVCAAVALIIVVVLRRPLRIAYHEARMGNTWSRLVRSTHVDPDQSDLIDTYEHHRDALVSLGALRHEQFVLQHVPLSSDAYLVLLDVLRDLAASRPSVLIPQTDPVVIHVWCPPNELPQWASIISAHDIPASD